MSEVPEGLTAEERSSWIGARVIMGIREYIPQFLSIMVGIVGAIVAAPAVLELVASGGKWAKLDGSEKLACIIVPVLLGLIIVSSILNARQKSSKNSLQRTIIAAERERDDYVAELASLRQSHLSDRRKAAETIQANLAGALELPLKDLLVSMGIWGEQCRVSAYRHDETTSKFVMISRISNDPSLAKSGRGTYPDDTGLISTAWTLGECDDDCNRTDPVAWAKYHERNADLPFEIGIKVRMKARSIRGLRVDDGAAPHQLGVLIFEHMVYQRFSQGQPLSTLSDLASLPAFECIQTAFRAVPPHIFQLPLDPEIAE